MSEVRNPRSRWIVLLLTIPCLMSPCLHAQYGGGTGEPNAPYLIYTPAQMNAIGADPNDWDKHFKLMADIDLSQYPGEQFNLIGYYIAEEDPNNRPFRGVFDGNGHLISHFRYAGADQNEVGLFRCVGDVDGEIRDLTLTDPNVSVPGGRNIGSLIGYLQHGGMVRCRTRNGVVSGQENVGGLVGKGGPEVTRVTVGSRVYPAMSDCGFTGVVTATRYAGGLVGFNLTGQITGCRATGQVTATEAAGGLAGTHRHAGMTNCYAIVNVLGDKKVGGLVGESSCGVINCYAASKVSGVESVGGLVGTGSHEVTGSYWDTQTSGQSTSAGGTGKTTAELQRADTFFFWNACAGEAVWTIDEGKDYPRLQWEGSPGRVIEAVPLAARLAGRGTSQDPYLIYTAEQLNLLGLYRCEMDKHYRLMADIDLSAYPGDQFNVLFFSGTFDGNHHAIAHFTYTGITRNWVGLFAYIWNGSVRDLDLIDPQVDIGTGYGAGALVGSAWRTTITNCHVRGGRIAGRDNIGGLVGSSDATICDCSASTTVAGSEAVGGLAGGHGDGTITRCSASGSVTSEYAGGGLVGMNGGKIVNSRATTCVTGNAEAGGLVGDNGGAILDCYAAGSVTGDAPIGGLVGINQGTIANCYATGGVTGISEVGGLVGYGPSPGATFVSFWNMETSGTSSSDGGEGKTTAQLQRESTFAGWGENGVWTLDEGKDFPRLVWENQPGKLITNPTLSGVAGTGRRDDPYLIASTDQLTAIGLFPTTWDKHFRLVADVDLAASAGTPFPIIGTASLPFTGMFDGNGHTISHFHYECTDQDDVGLFRYVGDPNAELRDLVLAEASVETHEWEFSVASLVGHLMAGTVRGCRATGSVRSSHEVGGLIGRCDEGSKVVDCHAAVAVQGERFTGGLIGTSEATVTDCTASGVVSGESETGGLIGCNLRTVSNSYATGAVSGQEFAGGLAGGSHYYGIITGCHATGNVDANDWAGGLVGCNWQGNVCDSFATGDVTSGKHAGGLIGGTDGTIRGCYARGAVQCGAAAGGLLGIHLGVLSNSYATGNATGQEGIGGLIGGNAGDVLNCYAAGKVSGGEWVGGLVGYWEQGTCTACFWDIITTDQPTSDDGTGKTTKEMQTASTFLEAGWDFVDETVNGTEDIWWIDEGQDYPRLAWELDADDPKDGTEATATSATGESPWQVRRVAFRPAGAQAGERE